MDLGLAGKQAVVTGATRGLGRAIAEGFVSEGAEVLAIAREGAALAVDLRKPGSIQVLKDHVGNTWGGADILVCNVGSGRSVPPGTETSDEWRRVLDINLFTAVHAIEALRAHLRPGGAILCISSITGRRALGAPATYSAAKAALDSLVVNLARPLAKRDVRIVGVAPGNLLFEGSVWETKRTEDPQAVDDMLAREVAQARLGRPEEVANAALFLASDKASFITGTVVVCDGGQVGMT